MDFFLGLAGLFCLLATLGLIGVGFWAIVSSILKATPEPPTSAEADRPRRHRCPACHTFVLARDRVCRHCRLRLDGPLAERIGRLRSTASDVRDLADRGELEPALAEPVVTALDRHIQQILASRLEERAELPRAKPVHSPAEPPVEPVVTAGMTFGEPFVARAPTTERVSAPPPPPVVLPRPEPLPLPEPEPPSEPEQHPRHGMLAAFMEERNILWGELVGGLLIVGCSIALVVTLWRSLEALPYFPFLLATGITAALYGAGQYTLHHWKLASTSRGLLVIALLLAPLNLLLLAGLASEAAGGWLDVAVKLGAVGLFVGLVRGAGRDLIGTHLLPGPIDRRWLLALAVVGAPASQALPVGWVGEAALWVALGCYIVACGAVLGGLSWYRPRAERAEFSGPQATALLTFLGISLFALLAAWGLVITRAPDLPTALATLAFPLAVASVLVVEAGLLVQRRSPGDLILKTTGTAVAVTGSLLLAVGVVLSWPYPAQLLLVSSLAGTLFARESWRESMPVFQGGAIPAFGLALLLAAHGLAGHWVGPANVAPGVWLRGLLNTPTSALVLVGYALVLATTAEGIARARNMAQAAAHALGGIGAGALGWFLAMGVVGTSANQRLPAGWVGEVTPWVALGCHLVAGGAVLGGLRRYRPRVEPAEPSERPGHVLLSFLGISLFALIAAGGMVLTGATDVHTVVAGLSFPLALAAIPLLETGLLLQRGSPDDSTPDTTGWGLGAAGVLFILASFTLAWPDPTGLLLVSSLAGAIFTRLSWRESLPRFQAGAIPAFGLALLLAVHGLAGHWVGPVDAAPGWWLRSLGTSTSGLVLVGFGLVLAASAEGIARVGNFAQATAHAMGGVIVGTFGLLLVSVHGVEEPWPAVAAHAVSAVGLQAANVRWRQRAVAEAGAWLVLVATLWGLWGVAPTDRELWGLVVSVESLTLAMVALALTPRAARFGVMGVMFGQVRNATANVSAAAGAVAVVLTLAAPGFPYAGAETISLLLLAPTGLLLARVFTHPWPTWAGSLTGLLGLAHFTTFTLVVEPVAAALLCALLGHASLELVAARRLRGRRSRDRLLASPLRQSAWVTSGLAVPFLLVPSAGMATEWAGFAVWLAVLWFVLSWVWRETGAFSAAQVALTAAAAYGGLGWAQGQEWWTNGAPGSIDLRVWHGVGTGLALLGLVWVGARRVAAGNERLRALWLPNPYSVDRVVMGLVVIGQLIVLAVAIVPAVMAELIPTGRVLPPAIPAGLSSAFGPGAWLVLGLLAAGLVGQLRLATEDEPDADPTLLGLAVLALSVPVAWAGAFGPELAAASALRWGLAATFLVGSAILFAREPVGRWATRAGFRIGTSTAVSLHSAYVLAGLAAGVVLLLTIHLTVLGISRIKPSGPAEGSFFAQIGYTASFLVPLGLVIVGLTGTAVRERLAGYAFAAGVVLTGAVASGYALVVITGGGTIDDTQSLRIGMLAVAIVAAWGLLWIAAERRVPGGPFLNLQAILGLVGIGALILVPFLRLFARSADPLPSAFVELGRVGWVALALAGWAAFERATRSGPPWRGHVLGFVSVVAGVLAACAVQPLDAPGHGISLLAGAIVWAVAGLGLTVGLGRVSPMAHAPWLGVMAGLIALAGVVFPTSSTGLWLVPLALASYALFWASIVITLRRRRPEIEWPTATWYWLMRYAGIIGVVALLLALVTADGNGVRLERLAGPLAVGLLAVTAVLLAEATPAPLAPSLRICALLLATGGVALVGWAVPNREEPVIWLQRNVGVFVALVGVLVACLEAIPRLRPGTAWAADARQVGGVVGAVSLVALLLLLLLQMPVFDPNTRRTPLGPVAVVAVLGAVGVLIAMSIRAAVRPATDPFSLPDSRRTGYVYLAEGLLVLFFIHVRLNIPEIFRGQAVRYWTFLVMLLAFVGIGLGEFFERRRLMVLAGPLRRTGVFLPLIPLLAFWAKPPGFVMEFADGQAPGLRPLLGYLEKLPQHFDSYAGLWFMAGLLYGLLALTRRSFGWALLGALATNAGVWALLTHTGVSATAHPQVWVIPLALIVLVSEHVNRKELRAEVSAGLRYLGIGMLYVSSSADMFIAGLGESLWLPVILAALCVAGVLAGVVLRVRAFLFLGTGFLLLDVFAMIWHAAVDRDQTWVWYTSGIVLGAAILALFALFEKRRNELLAVVDRIRTWD